MTAPLTLRQVEPDDSRLLWEWRNAPDVRALAFTPDPIPWADHERWFAQKTNDPRCLLFRAEAGGVPIGQVRLDVEEEGTEAEISVSVQRAHRGRGFGTALIEKGVRAAAEVGVHTVHAYIKPENEASVRAFERAGFDAAGIQAIRGSDALHYVWHRAASQADF